MSREDRERVCGCASGEKNSGGQKMVKDGSREGLDRHTVRVINIICSHSQSVNLVTALTDHLLSKQLCNTHESADCPRVT